MSDQQHERDYLRGYATALIDAMAAIEFARDDRRSLRAPANAWLEGGTEDALKVIRAMKPPGVFDDRKLPAVEWEHADLLTTRITSLSHALRKIARAGRLSSLSVPVLDDAADEIDKLTAELRAAPRETRTPLDAKQCASKPCQNYLDIWRVGDEWLKMPEGAVCPRCGFTKDQHTSPVSPADKEQS